LVFINNPDQAQVYYRHDSQNFASRSLVKNEVTITDHDGDPLSGNFSVSVTSDREVTPDSTMNILTYLLLTSDLRGHIENPAYYFGDNPKAEISLEMLMLTQGWRRYNIAELAQGHYAYPTMPIEAGSEITGTVKFLPRGNPAQDIDVTLLAQDGYFDTSKTNKDGRFSFDCDMPDSTQFIVNIAPKRGNTQMRLTLDKEDFPKKTLSTVPPAEKIDRNMFAKYADKAERKYTEENGMRMYFLSEVTVSAQQKKQRIESPFYFSKTLPPSSTITADDIIKLPGATMYLLLMRVPGVRVSSEDGVKIRSIKIGPPVSVNFEPVPLIVIDDVTYAESNMERLVENLNMIQVNDIAQIDVLKGPEVATFGVRGAGGVICIYTKRGENSKIKDIQYNTQSLTPLGYQQPVEFYAPKYDTPEKRKASGFDLRTTIHWQPFVQMDNLGVASFEFYTADESTSYSVVIEGISNDGRIIRSESKLWKRTQ
jgi:hypothetical protein